MMDPHRIPDDLSIPEFLKRNRRRIRSDYELDDVESRVLLRTLQAMVDKDERAARQRILAALAHKVRQGPHLIVNNTLH